MDSLLGDDFCPEREVRMKIDFGSLTWVRNMIRECEGKHIQQVAYSTYHDAMTQICFGCGKISTSLPIEEVQEDSK